VAAARTRAAHQTEQSPGSTADRQDDR